MVWVFWERRVCHHPGSHSVLTLGQAPGITGPSRHGQAQIQPYAPVGTEGGSFSLPSPSIKPLWLPGKKQRRTLAVEREDGAAGG